MNSKIKRCCEKLTRTVNEYSLCGSCGHVTMDSSLLLPDPFNPGLFRSICPECKRENMRYPFPPKELGPLFEMIAESAERERSILVLILSCTVYEALIGGFFFHLLERYFTHPDICEAVNETTEYRSKMRIIRSITGIKPKELAKSVGYEKLMCTLESIKIKRNGFLHTGIVHENKNRELLEEDVLQALEFTIDVVDCFAKLHSEYREYEHICDPDY